MCPITNKIKRYNSEYYIIIYKQNCSYCAEAVSLLKNKRLLYKKYDIMRYPFGQNKLISELRTVLNLPTNHATFPIIFKGGRFVGGYSDLVASLSTSTTTKADSS